MTIMNCQADSINNSKRLKLHRYLFTFCKLLILVMMVYPVQGGSGEAAKKNGTKSGNTLPISYDVDVRSIQEQKPLIAIDDKKEAGTTDDRYITPVVIKFDEKFRYAYALSSDSPLAALPLVIEYCDGEADGVLGIGWRLAFTFFMEKAVTHDILSPGIGSFDSGGQWFLYVEGEQIPVQRYLKDEKEYFTANQNPEGALYTFLKLETDKAFFIVPHGIKEKKMNIAFDYAAIDGLPLLMHLRSMDWFMDFTYEKQGLTPRLSGIKLAAVSQDNDQPLRQWSFKYETGGGTDPALFLREISIGTRGLKPQSIEYAYEALDNKAGTKELQSLCEGEAGSLWEKGDPWHLPGKWSLKRNKGLRFFEIDKSKPIDLVNVKERGLQSWLWDKKKGGREDYHDFEPERKLLHTNGLPAGSQLTSLWKDYPPESNKIDTNGYQSIVTSYYLPGSDGKIEYHSEICFPNIICKEGRCSIAPDLDGKVWDCDDHQVLQLPFPLQYEGKKPWPEAMPGIRPRETMMNQGAQFVRFGPYRNGLHYYAIWLRYIDEDTGNPLLAEHRDWYPENCRKRYSTEWNYHGGKKNVRVEICQAFWGKRGLRWMESDENKEQWVRLDLDRQTGLPNGNYILPWHGPDNPDPPDRDPDFNFHYEGFRNVSFAELEPRQTYAVIYGTSCDSCPTESKRPTARHIYKLKNRKWVKVDRNSGFYSPEAVFKAKKLMFVDINNDGYDDLIQTDRRPAKVYINIKRLQQKNAWMACPPFELPHNCNLSDNCRFIALKGDEDKDLDLFIGDGKTTFYNLVNNSTKRPMHSMTLFTDENLKRRSVSGYLSNKIQQ